MNRNLRTRLDKLEAAKPDAWTPWRQITADSKAEAEAEQQAMLADGRAQPGDRFIFNVIVSPPGRETA